MKKENQKENIPSSEIDKLIRANIKSGGKSARIMSSSCSGGGGGTTSSVPGCASKKKT